LPLAGLALASLLATSVAHAAHAAPAAPAASSAASAPSVPRVPTASGTDALSQLLGTFVIGNPLPALSDCADSRTPDGKDVTALCVELRGDGMMRQVGVPRDKRPAFMDGPYLLALVDGNALVGVIVPTDGVKSQDAAEQSLSARYGKPFRKEMVDMKDKGGNAVKTIHAGWMHRPLTVELYAIPEDPSEGTIELLLPQARALMANRDAEVAKSLAPPASDAAAKKPAKGADKKPAPAKPVNPGSW